ncbi:hypothetical protein ACYCJ8_23110, partial [Klebsiella pneumoniae]
TIIVDYSHPDIQQLTHKRKVKKTIINNILNVWPGIKYECTAGHFTESQNNQQAHSEKED